MTRATDTGRVTATATGVRRQPRLRRRPARRDRRTTSLSAAGHAHVGAQPWHAVV